MHLLGVVASIAICLYLALVVGTPKVIQRHFDYLQAIGWAIGIDTLVLEVLKNRVLILMRNFAVAHDEKVELEKSNLQRVDPASLYGRGKALPADADSEMGGGAPYLEEYEFDDVTGDLAFTDIASVRPTTNDDSEVHEVDVDTDAASSTVIEVEPTENAFEDISTGVPTARSQGSLLEIDEELRSNGGLSEGPPRQQRRHPKRGSVRCLPDKKATWRRLATQRRTSSPAVL